MPRGERSRILRRERSRMPRGERIVECQGRKSRLLRGEWSIIPRKEGVKYQGKKEGRRQ